MHFKNRRFPAQQKLTSLLVVFLILLISKPSSAQSPITLDQFCELQMKVISDLHQKKSWADQFKKIGTVLDIALHARQLAFPVLENTPKPDAKPQIKNSSQTLVAVLLKTQTESEAPQDPKLNFVKERNQEGSWIKHLHTKDECVAKLKEKNFNLEHYLKAYTEWRKSKKMDDQDHEAEEDVSKLFTHAPFNSWSITRGKSYIELQEEIIEKKPETLVIAAHASSEGLLIDAENRIIPFRYFRWLKEQGVKEIVIFSCHSHSVADYYELGKLNLSVFTTQTRSSWQNLNPDEVPMSSLKHYLQMLKPRLSLIHSSPPATPETPYLVSFRLKLKGIQGIVEISLDQKVIGYLRVAEDLNQDLGPLDLGSPGLQHSLTIRPIELDPSSNPCSDDVAAALDSENQTLLPTHVQSFPGPEGEWRRTLININ